MRNTSRALIFALILGVSMAQDDHDGHDHGDKDDHDGHDHGGKDDHDGHDHGGKDDHDGHDHGGKDDHDGHDHGGKDDHDGHDHGITGNCVCKAQQQGWKLDCTNTAKIEEAVAKLDAKDSCLASSPPEDCVQNYYVMQAHHDHCLHDSLPTGIEKKLHDYENFYDDCFVKRQFNPALSICPMVDCSDSMAMNKAVDTLQAGCTTTCANNTCAAAIKTVLMAHDMCKETDLPKELERALHDHEEPCEAQLCNTQAAAFDPYSDPCKIPLGAYPLPEAEPTTSGPPTADTASGFGSREAFLVTTLAVLISPYAC